MKIVRSKREWEEWVDFEDDMTEEEEKEYYLQWLSLAKEEYLEIKKQYDDVMLLPNSMVKTYKLESIQTELSEKEKNYTEQVNNVFSKYWESIIDFI